LPLVLALLRGVCRGFRERSEDTKIVIVGGTGLIGSKSAPLLRSRGHEVLQASPSKGVNAVRFDDWLGRAAA
jgi:uncharacterized protein YbjT (DUF2867 family)